MNMTSLYITMDDGMLCRSGDALVWKKARRGEKANFPPHLLEDVIVIGNGSVSTQAVHLLLDNNIPLHYISGSGAYLGSLTSGRSRRYKVFVDQYLSSADPVRSQQLASSIVRGKLDNQKKTLLRAFYRKGCDRDNIMNTVRELKDCIGQIPCQKDIASLRGIEGVAGAKYFSVFEEMLARPWYFTRRNRRPPKDPVNVLLSFGYTLLLGTVMTAVTAAGLEPCIGWLHPEYRGRPSAALDLMEEFRSVVVDRLVTAVTNQNIVSTCDFTGEGCGITLSREAVKKFVREYWRRIETEAVNEASGNKSSYHNHIFSQAAALAKSLTTGKQYLPFQA